MAVAGLDGATVILTGSAGDIGVTYLQALTAAGANVVAADIPAAAEQGQAAVDKASVSGPGRAVFVGCDVTEDDHWAAVVERAQTEFGRIDALVNNAAIYRALGDKRPLTELRNEDWDLVLRVNVRGTWQGIKAVARPMADSGGGRIVNISSVVARTGAVGFAHYVASKAAVDGLTRAAARELGGRGITVNAVAPGLVTDEATRTLNADEYIAAAAKNRSVPREMVPEDLVGAVLWLASPAAGFVSGQTVIVDGGGVFA
jgi:NAD(P)-dependent dehydrogenase (short-subunit alcohol dehydrogenase family)